MKYIFSLAALALMTAACSSDENTQSQSAPSGKTLPFRAVITAGTPVTRGLTEGDKTISAAWVKDEKVESYRAAMEKLFGTGACSVLQIRKYGGMRVI